MVPDDPGQLGPLLFVGMAGKVGHGNTGKAADSLVSGARDTAEKATS